MTSRTLADEALELGEGARWVDDRLVLVDILRGRLLEHPGTAVAPFQPLLTMDVPLGAVAPVADRPGQWIAAVGTGVALLDTNGRTTWLDRPEDRADGATRMNDGAADPAGRFWAGSMAYDGTTPLGSLYRVDLDGSVHRVWDGIAVVNGPAFTAGGRVMYLADTARGTILRFPVSAAGDLGEPQEHWRADGDDGAPDGMTVADDGTLLVAMWGGSEVRAIAPDTTTVARMPVAARQPTSVCLAAGRVLVTSACTGLPDPTPADGRLVDIDLTAHGLSATAPPACSYGG